jgi:hypothetical protein
VNLRFVVVGSGYLARSVCLALATPTPAPGGADKPYPVAVEVLGRDPAALQDLCTVAGLRAAAAGAPVRFTPLALPVTDESALARVFARVRPAAVLVCAATQSPWERLRAPSAWTALLERAGFGLSLPFQAEIALAVSRAAAPTGTPVLNACFPDEVNPLLAQLGEPVLAGVGNVGLLATALQAALGLPDQRRLRLLAHHLHLHTPKDPAAEAVAWLDDRPLPRVGALLAGVRAAARPGSHVVTGALAAQLLLDLATGETRDTHLPGVLGLPGGYPVRVHRGGIRLRLPEGYPVELARQVQQGWSVADGVVVRQGRVEFGPAAGAELERLVPELAGGFALGELDRARSTLAQLRDRLRAGEGGG